MAEFPALPLWTDAYLGDTQHLSLEEHGAYLKLLIVAWRRADCDLPDDDVWLRRVLGVGPKKWAKLKPVAMAFWRISDGRWTQKKLSGVRRQTQNYKELKSSAGRASAIAKALKNNNLASTEGGTEGQQKINNPTPTPTPTPEPEVKPQVTMEYRAPEKARASKARAQLPESLFKDGTLEETARQFFGVHACFDLATSEALKDQIAQFQDYHRARASTMADWPAAWRTWMRNALKFSRQGQGQENGKERKSTALDRHLAGLASLLSTAPESGRSGSEDGEE